MKTDIVVGLDGSPSAKRALVWAMELAARTGASLRAVHVWRVETPEIYVPAEEQRHDWQLRALDDARRWFEEATGEAPELTPCALEVLEGAAAGPRLVAAADQAQLLVVGSSEHRGLGRLIHGSVGHYVLSHADCPVVLVPRPAPVKVRAHASHLHREPEAIDVPRF